MNQRDRLEELIPAGSTFTQKRELFADYEAVFSGRCDPAAVCCLLATLEESDLRGLREQLRGCLATVIPATAGGPLRIRQSGNVCAFADDCWKSDTRPPRASSPVGPTLSDPAATAGFFHRAAVGPGQRRYC